MGRVRAGAGRRQVPSPPVALLWAAAVAVAGGAVLVAAPTFTARVAGYVLSSFVTIGFLAACARLDVLRSHLPGYRPSRLVQRASPLIAVAGVAVAAIHVWAIATELAG